MKVPQHLVDRLLADGEVGVFISVVLLGAALAVKRGGDPTLEDICLDSSGEPLSPWMKQWAIKAHAVAVEDFRRALPDELECSIAVYAEHLRQAGYSHSVGKDN